MAKTTRFTEADLFKYQQKGLFVNDPVMSQKLAKAFLLPKDKKVLKRPISSPGKDHIEFVLISLNRPFVKEYKFLENRKFRFDFAIIDINIKIAIEYEGIFSENSRHTNNMGYVGDIRKYNIAIIEGWKVLRYSAINYKEIYNDLEKLFI